MTIPELQTKAHENAITKGFHKESDRGNVKHIIYALAMIHSEVSEALDALRHENMGVNHEDISDSEERMNFGDFDTFKALQKNTFSDELSDIAIRVADLAEWTGVDLDRSIRMKMKYNESRPHKHGKAF